MAMIDEASELYRQSSYKSVPENSIKPTFPVPMQKAVSTNEQYKETDSMMDEEEGDRTKEYELIIQQYDGPQTSFYSVKEEGAKIGRHSSNQILILDESISRFHADIKFENGAFYLRDTGSTTGTFIKIQEKVIITPVNC